MDESELIAALERIPGKAGAIARAVIAQYRERLIALAQIHAHGVAHTETTKDAVSQWGKVADAAHKLTEALSGLGGLACGFRLDVAVKDPGLYKAVQDFLPVVPGGVPVSALYDLETFAFLAQEHARAIQKQANGGERRNAPGDTEKRQAPLFLLEQVSLICAQKGHAARMVEVIHTWATGGRGRLTPGWERNARRILKKANTPPGEP